MSHFYVLLVPPGGPSTKSTLMFLNSYRPSGITKLRNNACLVTFLSQMHLILWICAYKFGGISSSVSLKAQCVKLCSI